MNRMVIAYAYIWIFCRECHTESAILVKSVAESFTAKCSACGSNELVHIMSRFAYHKSMKTIHEEAGEPRMFSRPDYYKDPRNIGRWTEKRFKEMGLEMPTTIREEIQAAREGELPASLKGQL